VDRYGKTRQTTDGSVIGWITKATDIHSEYVIIIFRSKNGYANAPQYYVYMYIACLVFLTVWQKIKQFEGLPY